jgi:CRP-like cAMP-binding protein
LDISQFITLTTFNCRLASKQLLAEGRHHLLMSPMKLAGAPTIGQCDRTGVLVMLGTIPVQNRILAHLPDAALNTLRSYLKVVHLMRHEVLQEQLRPIYNVYFIESGMANLFDNSDRDGRVELGIVGRYGFVGVPIVLGKTHAAYRCVTEVEGDALKVNASALRRWMLRHPGVRLPFMNFAQAFLVQTSQMSLCNLIHPLIERLGTWLLLSHDRLDGNKIPLDREFLSLLLNEPWSAIETALTELGSGGAVKTQQGHIEITDRSFLEERACKCYGTISGAYRRLVGPP